MVKRDKKFLRIQENETNEEALDKNKMIQRNLGVQKAQRAQVQVNPIERIAVDAEIEEEIKREEGRELDFQRSTLYPRATIPKESQSHPINYGIFVV